MFTDNLYKTMPNTYTQLYIHLVFAVKGRASLISKQWKEELYKYICGIVNQKKQKIYAINGMPDHIHILISMKPDVSPSDIVREIKANSSKWINEKGFVKGKFQWQEGFGAFSCSQSHTDATIKYIEKQEIHHSKKSFKEEYLDILQKYNVEDEEKYIFEEIE